MPYSSQALWFLLRALDTPNSLETKGNLLIGISSKNASLKAVNSQTSVMVQRDIPANNLLDKLTRDAHKLAPRKGKTILKI